MDIEALRAKRKPDEGEPTIGEIGTFGSAIKLVGYTKGYRVLLTPQPQ